MKIYLINGESYLQINEEIFNIIKDSKNVTTFDLNANSLEDVFLEAGYFSMFEDEKYIIVKNANFFGSMKIKESDTELLLNYFAKPHVNSTIIFICNEKIDTRKKISKIIKEKYSLITIPNLKYYEIENRLKNYFTKLKYKIDDESVKYLVSSGQNNYDIIMNEASKITLYYDEPCKINYHDVINIVSKSFNSNNFLFVDALVENNLEKSLSLYNDLKVIKTEPTALISLIARDFRIMYNIKKSLEENKSEYTIMRDLNLADWQLNKYLNKVFPYKIKELESILIKLSNLDLNIKNGKVDKFIGLELFILDLCS